MPPPTAHGGETTCFTLQGKPTGLCSPCKLQSSRVGMRGRIQSSKCLASLVSLKLYVFLHAPFVFSCPLYYLLSLSLSFFLVDPLCVFLFLWEPQTPDVSGILCVRVLPPIGFLLFCRTLFIVSFSVCSSYSHFSFYVERELYFTLRYPLNRTLFLIFSFFFMSFYLFLPFLASVCALQLFPIECLLHLFSSNFFYLFYLPSLVQ